MSNAGSNFMRLVMEILEEERIAVQLFSDGWVFRIQRGQEAPKYLYGYQFGLNSDSAEHLCNDKSAAAEIFKFCHIPHVEHSYFMNPEKLKFARPEGNWERAAGLLKQYGTVVCKDNEGTGGNAVYLAHNQLELEAVTHRIMEKSNAMALSPYLAIQEEYRIIVLEGRARLGYRKVRPSLAGDGVKTVRELYAAYLLTEGQPFQTAIPEGELERVPARGEEYPLHWKHNLGQGAGAQILAEPETKAVLERLALQAADALSVSFASVDIVRCPDGYRIMEVNSGVMMEYLSGIQEEYRLAAREIYREAIHAALDRR